MLEPFLIALGLVLLFRQRARLQILERRIGELELTVRASGASPGSRPAPDVAEPLATEAPLAQEIAASREGPAEPAPERPAQAPRRPGLEERIGTRWAVWVGGLALALGGVLLVRYSIEQDLVGPGLRVALGAFLALALTGCGEWLRRRDKPIAVGTLARANLPAVLTAAGTSTAFAVVYAAYALYGLLGPVSAFLLLAAVSLGTIAASALHGPALSAFGLVAAFGSPLLVSTDDPNMPGLVAYLAFAAAAAYAVARLRLWRWLAVSGAAGALLWGFLIAFGDWPASAAAHALLQAALAIAFLVADPHRATPERHAVADRLASGVLGSLAVLAVVVAATLGHGPGRPLFGGAFAGMLLAAAYRFPAAASAAAAAAFFAIGTLASWPVEGEAGAEPVTVLDSMTGGSPMPAAVGTYLVAALLFGAAVAGSSLLRVLRGRELRTGPAAWYLAAATLGPLAGLVAVYGRVGSFGQSASFALAAASLGAGYGAAARLFRAEEGRCAPARLAVGATASAAVAALALGLTMVLDRGTLTVSLALAALGTAYVGERVAVPALRYVVGALGLVVAARLALDPGIVGDNLGRTPVLNWLLFGYGVPALSFFLAARILARVRRDAIVALCETLAILLSALLVFLEIRHAIHDGDIYALDFGILEAGLTVAEGLCFSILTARLGRGRPEPLYRFLSLAFAAASLAWAAATLFLFENPSLTGERIAGGPVLNTLLPAYLIPAVLAAFLARAARGFHPRWFVLGAAAFALTLELAYAGLEVRRLFQGPDLSVMRWTGDGELWSYSLVLLVNGVVLLAFGLVRDVREARLASAACILAAVVKVFVVDLAGLQGLMRGLSFVGLGLVLVAIGFAYQRLLGGGRGGREPGGTR